MAVKLVKPRDKQKVAPNSPIVEQFRKDVSTFINGHFFWAICNIDESPLSFLRHSKSTFTVPETEVERGLSEIKDIKPDGSLVVKNPDSSRASFVDVFQYADQSCTIVSLTSPLLKGKLGVLFKKKTTGATTAQVTALNNEYHNLDIGFNKTGCVGAEYYLAKLVPQVVDLVEDIRKIPQDDKYLGQVLLMEDSHTGHSQAEKIRQECRAVYLEKGVKVGQIPPNTTHILQCNDFIHQYVKELYYREMRTLQGMNANLNERPPFEEIEFYSGSKKRKGINASTVCRALSLAWSKVSQLQIALTYVTCGYITLQHLCDLFECPLFLLKREMLKLSTAFNENSTLDMDVYNAMSVRMDATLESIQHRIETAQAISVSLSDSNSPSPTGTRSTGSGLSPPSETRKRSADEMEGVEDNLDIFGNPILENTYDSPPSKKLKHSIKAEDFFGI